MASGGRWWVWCREKRGTEASCGQLRARRLARECALGPAGEPIMGHEFHHSEMLMDEREKVEYAIRLERGTGIKDGLDGVCEGNMVASYSHIHSASYRGFPSNFIQACRERKS